MEKNKPIIHPSSRELEVLETLWKADRSLTGTEIVESSPNKTWKESTIHILLKSLIKKSLIKVDGFAQTTTNIAKTFTPLISANEFLASQISYSSIYRDSGQVSFGSVVATLLKQSEDVTEKQQLVDELKKIIDEIDDEEIKEIEEKTKPKEH